MAKFCTKKYSTMVDIIGPVENRVETRCLGGEFLAYLANCTLHECLRQSEVVRIY